MNRERVKNLLPVIQAYAQGKEIEVRNPNTKKEWVLADYFSFEEPFEYRIKSEPKYRQFKNIDECWNEMLKHQPFGWIKDKTNTKMYQIIKVDNDSIYIQTNTTIVEECFWNTFLEFKFIDGTPFGIKEK